MFALLAGNHNIMYYRHIFTLLIVVILIPLSSNAQRWSRFKNQFSVGIGATNFLGDLGGATKGDGERFRDFQFSVTRPALTINYKYQFTDRFKARLGFSLGWVYGDDALAGNEGRKSRNLNFRSPIVELAPMLEWYFLKDNKNKAYSIRGMKGQTFADLHGYLFGGIGLFYFNPQGQDANGKWVSLADLNTEGQGLPGGPSDYQQFSISFPIGFGFGYNIDKLWSIGFEYGMRVSLTDYIDDVSSNNYYQDQDLLLASYGQKSLEMSDKRLSGRGNTKTGRRGNPDNNDAYMFAFFTLTKKFKLRPGSRTRF